MSGVAYAKGFKTAGVSCGLKKNGDKDLALIICENSANVAGVFTKNVVKGHSLQLCKKNIEDGKANAFVINSGCANACLGQRGMDDALAMANIVSRLTGESENHVLTASTGVIGVPLDMDKIVLGIKSAFEQLGFDGRSAAQAIMTTDTHPKIAQIEFELNGKMVRIGGMAKGSGMIHPDMATMISVITTDACIGYADLDCALRACVNRTFNKISVDGDTSVCDKVVVMASGMAGDMIKQNSTDYDTFVAKLNIVCEKLSKMLAADGEGATKLLTIKVLNANTSEDAAKMTSAIAKSPLCKTAAFGKDANWGRLITAAGYSGASFDPEIVDIYIGDVMVCKDGGGLAFDEDAALAVLEKDEVIYTIDLKQGTRSDVMWTCDLSYDYVRINGEYRT
jgi:glutamate N-acetyltransferase / amino-acid N-acetyltransferase